jgi:hypothetical protein
MPANSGSGQYVSIKVDGSGYVHLAFYNSKEQTVVYTRSTGVRDAGTPTLSFAPATAVDSVIKGGIWTDISVDNDGNPMIVYGETARMGNYDGARMAYKSSGTTGGFAFADDWEAVTMPSNYKVKDDRLNIEAWPPSVRGGVTLGTRPTSDTWNAAIGYAGDSGSGNTFRIGYFKYPAWKGYP